jgi:cell shape-determining protein MreC
MSKALIAIPYFILVALGLVLLGLVAIFAPEQFDKSTQSTITLLGIGSGAVVTFYMLGKQGATLEEVKTQTNGTNTELRKQNAELHRQVLELSKGAKESATSPQ